jgi:Tfp pilus assembly protein PilE
MFGISTKIIAIFAAIAIASVGAWGGLQYVKLQRANTARVEAVAAKESAERALDTAITANKTSTETIDAMKKEKKDIEVSLANLEAARQRDAKVITALGDVIKNQASNPENQVKLSPVLQEVIARIQAQRTPKVVK